MSLFSKDFDKGYVAGMQYDPAAEPNNNAYMAGYRHAKWDQRKETAEYMDADQMTVDEYEGEL